MDIKQASNFRTLNYKSYGYTGYNNYDYEQHGILTKTLPKILFKGNAMLVTFLQLIDVRLIILLKYIDRLKHFKHITWID